MDVFCKVQRQGFAANTSLRIPSSVDQKLRTLRGELFQHLKVYGTVYAVYCRVVQISTFFYFNYGEGGGNFIWV